MPALELIPGRALLWMCQVERNRVEAKDPGALFWLWYARKLVRLRTMVG